ncbi:response regulator [Candidatus Altiarchaeota archaeon]
MSKTIMVVDGDVKTRNYIVNNLLIYGFNVITAVNGLDCIDQLTRCKVDLVLIELLLPFMSGPETIKILKVQKGLKDLKVIGLNVMELDEKSLAYLKKMEVDDVVFKPVEIGDLVERIYRLIGKKA